MAQTFQNFNPDNLKDIKDIFQVQDCNGNNIGTPQDVLKTVVLNNVSTKDCNSDAVLAALQTIQANTTTSNTNEVEIISSLNDILTQVIAINSNTDNIENNLTDLINFVQTTNNILSLDIKPVLDNILLELQAIDANTDEVEALITATNTKLDTLIAEQDKELVSVIPLEGCVSGVKHFARIFKVYDSETATEVSEIVEYSADGLTGWTTTQPVGFTLGACSVAAPTLYNINETQVNAGVTPIVLPAATYHSVSVVVLSGSATIDNNGVSFVAPAGYSNTWEADTLLVNPITVTATTATDVVVIDTIK